MIILVIFYLIDRVVVVRAIIEIIIVYKSRTALCSNLVYILIDILVPTDIDVRQCDAQIQ